MTFAQDVFISFTHIDNQSLNPDEDGWISSFHKALEIRLSQLRGKESRIWRDRRLWGNEDLDEAIFDALTQSALLVSVLSPRYLQSEWCMRELQRFCQAADQGGGLRVGEAKARLFKVIKTYLPIEQHPAVVANFLGYEFYEIDDAGRPQEFDRVYGPEQERKFYAKLNDLAYDIHQTLEILDAQVGQPPLTEPQFGAVAADRKVIYLADTTPDLQVDRERIRRELEQAGHQVLPEQPLPSEPGAFKQTVCEALTRAHLSVHLLSPYPSQPPAGQSPTQEQLYRQLVTARTRDQVALAAQCGQGRSDFSRLLWLPPDTGAVAPDDFVTELQSDPDFIRTNLEALKDIIHTRLTQPATPALELSTDGRVQIYLDCDERDLENPAIDPLFEWLDQHFQVILPDYEQGTLSRSEALLQQCEAVLIYYGEASALWLKRRLNALKKTLYGRPKPLLAKAVYVADPAKQKFSDPEVLMIPGYQGFQPTLLEEFVASLGPAGGQA
ncbi:TIR domain-containing protein [Leptolyngbya iicbica]|uniref:TIR domain-containing protein n=2 Tax=Cyanophyceae TaxID=3028117 RepID=A0A4Q7E6N6_9CYAN|nr:TIR domain-containing protein [Leptolyngbya sp. LK]RZM77908.1 TIR domain-containing protein [Leptolyngbya sp. LK]